MNKPASVIESRAIMVAALSPMRRLIIPVKLQAKR